MPVGTPDYLCPEVLMRLQETPDGGQSQFNEDSDWWSVGICAYEMLYGRTPFTDENSSSMVVTYANIMNHKVYNRECIIYGVVYKSGTCKHYKSLRRLGSQRVLEMVSFDHWLCFFEGLTRSGLFQVIFFIVSGTKVSCP